MDNTELIKIAVAAVIATIFRELFTFAIKHSVKLAVKLRKLAISILAENTQILIIFGDLMVLALTGFSLCKSIFGHMAVDSSDVVGIAFNCILWFYWPSKLRQDFEVYKTEKNKIKNDLIDKSEQTNV